MRKDICKPSKRDFFLLATWTGKDQIMCRVTLYKGEALSEGETRTRSEDN